MPRQPYPLEALRKLRSERAEAQARSLAAQIARSADAEARLRERERERREHEARTAETVHDERQRLVGSNASGTDLQRLVEFEAAARVQAGALARAEASARQVLAEERAREGELRDELGRLEAGAALVRNHETSFHHQQAELQQRAEEEAALEQWSARRH
jgi:hypothetical protein